MKGYVIFENQAVFDVAHNAAIQLAGLPRIGNVGGKPAPNNQQTTKITSCYQHPSNETVVSYINGGWDESLKQGFDFLTRDQVSEYFPNDG